MFEQYKAERNPEHETMNDLIRGIAKGQTEQEVADRLAGNAPVQPKISAGDGTGPQPPKPVDMNTWIRSYGKRR